MSLPPGFLDEIRSRTSLAAVVARKVTWDNRKSNPSKGDYWAPCPFHSEKTASFHVEDRKGFYYCFGCHAKGDALTFVRETDNVSFMEAVEILAREAGLEMPAQDPRAKEKSDQRSKLADVMEAATQLTRLQLNTSKATQARQYLEARGLTPAQLERFEIGFVSNDRRALTDALLAKNFPIEDIVESGLAIKPDDGGAPFDRFRSRIIFPIRDARGRAIAWGGRAMDPNARAKYLNSPETPLFDKGRALYNHGPAREAAGKAQSLIVAEGYMDVIALVNAGFEHAVAPLGTAITEDQLRLMWRLADEPIIALDGDKAGVRAAQRLIEIALPLLEPGKSLRFAMMPEGQDPDDLIRLSGRSAMADLLAQARPLGDLLWRRETEGRVLDSPERRAAFDAPLRTGLNLIKDPSIRGHYDAEIRTRRRELFSPPQKQQRTAFTPGQSRHTKSPSGPTPSARASLLASTGQNAQTGARLREAAILLACINAPQLIEEFETTLDTLTFLNPDLSQLRDHILSSASDALSSQAEALDSDLETRLTHKLSTNLIPDLRALGPIRANRHLAKGADAASSRAVLVEEMAKHMAEIGISQETSEAEAELSGLADEGLTWRLNEARTAKEIAHREPLSDDGSSQSHETDLSQRLQKLIDDQVWVKKKG